MFWSRKKSVARKMAGRMARKRKASGSALPRMPGDEDDDADGLMDGDEDGDADMAAFSKKASGKGGQGKGKGKGKKKK